MNSSDILARHIAVAHGAVSVGALGDAISDTGASVVNDILGSADRFSQEHLVPLNHVGDRQGCTLQGGRVITPRGHKAAWSALCEGGWLMLDAHPDEGGLGLPSAIACAAQEIMDGACPAFGMMPVPIRAASRLLRAFGSAALQQEWLGPLVSGAWAATICISEPDAGSDVRRIKTRAHSHDDGSWRITGEKCWISFGDQDLTDRIGHFLLAKTGTGEHADAISLFLVPDRFGNIRNKITVRRIEDKLGLHLSPTCVLGFEEAQGFLIGETGRGLQQLFVMIAQMRMATAVQGAGIAARAYSVARRYASERRQGGNGPTPVTIEEHADIQRLLLGMAARLETLRGLIQTVANSMDLAAHSNDGSTREHAGALVSWLLPIIKTLGGEVAFQNASDAIQILGGAGYTQEWPVEQCLRDARVLTIFEGTTGMQAQDLLFRRLLKDGGQSFEVFLSTATADAQDCAPLAAGLEILRRTAVELAMPTRSQRDNESGATAFLSLASAVASGWIGARLLRETSSDPVSKHLVAAGKFAIADMTRRLPFLSDCALEGADALVNFGDLL